jgi:hypothetical protein
MIARTAPPIRSRGPAADHPRAELEGRGVGRRQSGGHEGRRGQVGRGQQGAVADQLGQPATQLRVGHLDHHPQPRGHLLDDQRHP